MKQFISAAILATLVAVPAFAQDTVKIGMIAPLTGQFTVVGQEMQGAAKVYLQHHGNTLAGKEINLIVKDDGGVPDASKRLAQELIVNEKVKFVVGMGLTPIALAIAPLVTQAKVPLVVMGAATSTIPAASPFIVRSSFSVPQNISVAGDYFAKQGVKNVVTIVSDYAPGVDTEIAFQKAFEAAGGKVIAALRVPLASTPPCAIAFTAASSNGTACVLVDRPATRMQPDMAVAVLRQVSKPIVRRTLAK
jgi:branched-chain amino acid transport system substrate-binding protein